MFAMFLDSAKLFLRGKLFRDTPAVLLRWLVAFLITTVVAIALSYANTWVAALVAGFAGGALMPYLLRNLKYA